MCKFTLFFIRNSTFPQKIVKLMVNCNVFYFHPGVFESIGRMNTLM